MVPAVGVTNCCRVSGVQMLLAVLCLVLQSVSVGMYDYWIAAVGLFKSQLDSNNYVNFEMETPDEAGTGIWLGVLVSVG